MDGGLPIAQEGYAQAASLLHRKHRISAPRVLNGMSQLSNAFLVLQALARGFLARAHAHSAAQAAQRAAERAAACIADFLAVQVRG